MRAGIRQVEHHGASLREGASNRDERDADFRGFGAGTTGAYDVRTMKPVPHPGRTPSIHVAVKVKGREKWTTPCYVEGHPGNEKDGIHRSIRDERQRAAVTVDFAALPGSKVGELTARFDLVPASPPPSLGAKGRRRVRAGGSVRAWGLAPGARGSRSRRPGA